MSKQEEIRKGINMKSPIPQAINLGLLQLLGDYRTYLVTNPLSPKYVILDEYIARAITTIMCNLHSQGVVRKVPLTEKYTEVFYPVEPLIEE